MTEGDAGTPASGPDGWSAVDARVAANLARVRAKRGLSTTRLAAELKDLGQPIPPTGITRIEKCQRRVNVGELLALSVALNISPQTLYLPETADDQPTHLAESYVVSSATAWAWAEGDRTASDWEPGRSIDFSEDPANLLLAEEERKEREFAEQQTAYLELSGPESRRRGRTHPAVRTSRVLADLLVDLVAPEPGVTAHDQAVRLRMARRRIASIKLELEELEEAIPGKGEE